MAEDGFILVPVWLSLTHDQVAAFSPTLADRIAIKAPDLPVDDVAMRIVERVRPDLFTAIVRRAAYESARVGGESTVLPFGALQIGPIRHEQLPTSYVNKIRVITSVFEQVAHLANR